ncbi:MAG: energy transducer TonB [Vicinamibacterales bacterium]
MPLPRSAAAEVFSVRETARAAGVTAGAVEELIDSGQVRAVGGFLSAAQAVRCVRLLRRISSRTVKRELFAPPVAGERSAGAALAASSALHGGMLGLLVLITTLGLTSAEEPAKRLDPPRLVFVATPGPGGGGGGGGLRQPAPPPKAQMKGPAKVKSPVPPPKRFTTRKPEPDVRRQPPPVPPRPVPRPVEPPPPAPRPPVTPQVIAPVVSASSDAHDRAGVLSESTAETESQGSGSGGGVGTGHGTGIGEGTGTGIGPGSGGGTGGGPYRPGSGITAPELLKEVRPAYTEDARRGGIEGDVVLEIVVRSDGSVGDVKVLQGLGGGLNRTAVDAVRQWRFSPARRHGVPVDVMVEVAVAFKLR